MRHLRIPPVWASARKAVRSEKTAAMFGAAKAPEGRALRGRVIDASHEAGSLFKD
jgi:hypothetical protein